jgi:glycosyltransferase involved in cell wall biosynthesis
MTVAILLSTYNGALFLEDLLTSILNQSYSEFTLYIRDDGSSDTTINIVESFIKKDKRVIFLNDEYANLGPLGSFLCLLDSVQSDFYFFADQDDIWKLEKIAFSLAKMKAIESNNQGKPVLIHTDLIVVNSDMSVRSGSFWKYSGIKPSLLKTFEYLAVTNCITGCTMVINDKAKIVALPACRNATMHDAWIALCVSNAKGIIDYVTQPTVFYRQHDCNAIGARKQYGLIFFVNRVLALKRVFRENESKYRMANDIRSFSVIEYLVYKLIYWFRRWFRSV